MLYQFVRFLLSITSKFYFRTLQVKGLENIPKTGPVFLVANHPAAFLDPMVLSTISPRPLSFLGKGILFDNKILQWLLPKFNVIPIYRSHETKGQAGKNKDVFVLCHKHFAKGGALLAFPEGISLTERKIKKIQTGTARICLGAEADYNYGLDIKIVPIGLNFSNPHKFHSDLFVNIDKPINVSDFYELYKQDTFKGAHALTDEIRVRLEAQVVAIQDADVDKLVSNIELIYKAQILQDLGHSPNVMEHDFNTTKSIRDSVHYFMEKDPTRVETIKTKINSYLTDLERISLTDGLIKGVEKKTPMMDTIKSFVYLVLGFPLFVYGTINNFLPFRIPGWAAPRISKSIEFRGPISFAMGTFTFLIFYSLQVWLVDKYTNGWPILLAYALSLPLSGLFAFYYYKRFLTIRGNWRILSLFYKKTNLITALITTRQQIIEELANARKEYVAYRDAK
jgi:glycerol-3-phosphate O-acyltransferase/dihydroxyacetone phosphate acyltransferase